MSESPNIELLMAEVESLRRQVARMETAEAQRVQAVKELRASEDRVSGILDMAHESIISIDESHNIVVFNKGLKLHSATGQTRY